MLLITREAVTLKLFYLPIYLSMQNTDAALLPTISYPAFAVDDDALYSQTLDKIVRKLRGKYGFKRFLRDGYRTTNEDKKRRYYKPAEMKVGTPEGCHFSFILSAYLRFISLFFFFYSCGVVLQL